MTISILIAKVAELKSRLKDANAELKVALEETEVFKNVLAASMEDTRYNVTEKIAAAHALKVALKHFTPVTDKGDE
jgi:hypothetical protein